MTDTAAVPPPRASLVHPSRTAPATFIGGPARRVRAADRFGKPRAEAAEVSGDRPLDRARDGR